MSDITFAGWGAFDKNASEGEPKRFTYKPKTWEDVDIEVLYSVIETAVRAGNQPYWVHGHTSSFDFQYVYGASQGEKTTDYKRSPTHFAFPILEGVDLAAAAPMLHGGITVYALLYQNGAGTTAKEVDIVGSGPLGHFAILFAIFMGANVTAISHSENKKVDAEQTCTARFIAALGRDNDFAPYKQSFNFILCTPQNTMMSLASCLSLLRPGGTLIMVGVPDGFLDLPFFSFILGNVHVRGSATGSPTKIKEMFELAVKTNAKPWIQKRHMEKTNEVISDMEAGKAEYRYVLVHEANGSKF